MAKLCSRCNGRLDGVTGLCPKCDARNLAGRCRRSIALALMCIAVAAVAVACFTGADVPAVSYVLARSGLRGGREAAVDPLSDNCIPAADSVARDARTGLIYADDMLIVMLEPDATDAQRQRAAEYVGGELVGAVPEIGMYQLRLPAGHALAELGELADGLMAEFECVTYATYDLAALHADAVDTPDDPWDGDVSRLDWQDGGVEGSNWWLEAISAPQAWALAGELPEIAIGICDNAFDVDHEELKGRVAFPNAVLESRNALPVWWRELGDAESRAASAHGTRVAGIIGARADNAAGIAGVVPNCELLLAPYAWSEQLGGYLAWDSSACANLVSLVRAGARVVNFSQGKSGGGATALDAEALAREGRLAALTIARLTAAGYEDFLVVQSAGNGAAGQAQDAVQNGLFASVTDASLDGCADAAPDEVRAHILIVGAVELTGSGYAYAGFSNYGAQVDVCAPGVDIYSAEPGALTRLQLSGGYGYQSGTSMAAPIAAGVCALVWAADPELSAAEVKAIVRDSCEVRVRLSSGEGAGFECGMVDAYRALRAALPAGATDGIFDLANASASTRVDASDDYAHLAEAWADLDGDGALERVWLSTAPGEAGMRRVLLFVGDQSGKVSAGLELARYAGDFEAQAHLLTDGAQWRLFVATRAQATGDAARYALLSYDAGALDAAVTLADLGDAAGGYPGLISIPRGAAPEQLCARSAAPDEYLRALNGAFAGYGVSFSAAGGSGVAIDAPGLLFTVSGAPAAGREATPDDAAGREATPDDAAGRDAADDAASMSLWSIFNNSDAAQSEGPAATDAPERLAADESDSTRAESDIAPYEGDALSANEDAHAVGGDAYGDDATYDGDANDNEDEPARADDEVRTGDSVTYSESDARDMLYAQNSGATCARRIEYTMPDGGVATVNADAGASAWDEYVEALGGVRRLDGMAASGSGYLADNAYACDPGCAFDGNVTTAWCSDGARAGQWLRVDWSEPQRIAGIALVNGYAKNADVWRANARAKLIALYADGDASSGELLGYFYLDDDSREQYFPLDARVELSTLTIAFVETYAGDKYDDLCMSELALYAAAADVPERDADEAAGSVRAVAALNLRAQPGLEADILTEVPAGALLEYMGAEAYDAEGARWINVRWGAQTGWLLARYVQYESEGAVPAEPDAGYDAGDEAGHAGDGAEDASDEAYHASVDATAQPGGYVINTTGKVNLRSEPNIGAASLCAIPERTALSYAGRDAVDDRGVRWFKVSYGGETGWVSSKYAEFASGGGAEYVRITGQSTNLRSAPSLNGENLAVLHKDDELIYRGETARDDRGVDWYAVEYDGGACWVSSKYAELK